jgi:hypothetical protein
MSKELRQNCLKETVIYLSYYPSICLHKLTETTGIGQDRQFSGRELYMVASQKEARIVVTHQRCLILANLIQNVYPYYSFKSTVSRNYFQVNGV